MHDTPDLLFDPHFLDAPHDVFQHLMASVEWDTRMRARRTASYGVAYNYSQIDYPATVLPDAIQSLCEQLDRRLGFLPNNCLLNLYDDGQSSMGFHSDDCTGLAPDTGVAILSLGSTRPIHFRSKADRQREVTWELLPGSLLYMDQAVQAHWLHAIPRVESAGPRLSLTFRRILG